MIVYLKENVITKNDADWLNMQDLRDSVSEMNRDKNSLSTKTSNEFISLTTALENKVGGLTTKIENNQKSLKTQIQNLDSRFFIIQDEFEQSQKSDEWNEKYSQIKAGIEKLLFKKILKNIPKLPFIKALPGQKCVDELNQTVSGSIIYIF